MIYVGNHLLKGAVGAAPARGDLLLQKAHHNSTDIGKALVVGQENFGKAGRISATATLEMFNIPLNFDLAR